MFISTQKDLGHTPLTYQGVPVGYGFDKVQGLDMGCMTHGEGGSRKCPHCENSLLLCWACSSECPRPLNCFMG